MKKIIFGLLLALGITASTSAKAVNIVALVNGEIISNEDLNSQINLFMLNTPIPLNNETRPMITRRVLAQAIEAAIKRQSAQKENIVVSDEEIKQQKKAWLKGNKLTSSSLKEKGISDSALNENLKSEIAWIKLIRKKFYQTANITQKEIEETAKEISEDMSIKKYQFQEIFIKKENAQDINSLVAKLKEDPRFELYAASFSEAPSASNGGNLGWVNSGKMLSALEMRLSSMNPGDISDAILVGNGYYILKLLQVFTPNSKSTALPKSEEVKNLLENQKMEALSRKLLQDLKQKATIEVKG